VNVLIESILEMWLKQQPNAPELKFTHDGKSPQSELTPRPTYAERRTKQIESGEAKPIPFKLKKTVKLRRQWVDCKPEMFLDAEGGIKRMSHASKMPQRFKLEEEARAAEAAFFEATGLHELVTYCDVCKAFHVRHVFSRDLIVTQEKAAQIA
jgi:hypothetical protein